MKVNKDNAIKFLVSLGFKANEWDDAKLKDRIGKIPSKVEASEVEEEFEELFESLNNSDPADAIIWDTEKEPKAKEEKSTPIDRKKEPKAPAKKKAPAAKKKAATPKKSTGKPAPSAAATPKKKAAKPAAKKAVKKEATAELPLEDAPAAKPAAKGRTRPDPIEKDNYGCRMGTISERINSTIEDEWKTDEQIRDDAGVTLGQARARLYHGVTDGHFEMERVVRYRIRRKK